MQPKWPNRFDYIIPVVLAHTHAIKEGRKKSRKNRRERKAWELAGNGGGEGTENIKKLDMSARGSSAIFKRKRGKRKIAH